LINTLRYNVQYNASDIQLCLICKACKLRTRKNTWIQLQVIHHHYLSLYIIFDHFVSDRTVKRETCLLFVKVNSELLRALAFERKSKKGMTFEQWGVNNVLAACLHRATAILFSASGVRVRMNRCYMSHALYVVRCRSSSHVVRYATSSSQRQ